MSKLTANQKNLIRRYLVWCYKTNKEELDRIDRYYTQFIADEFMLDRLQAKMPGKDKSVHRKYLKRVDDFKTYLVTKKENADKKKFQDVKVKTLDDNYIYLQEMFGAIKKAIIYFLGKKELGRITALYEKEMTRRILEARDHS